MDQDSFSNGDNSMSESWDPLLFMKADDSIFNKLYQHSFTETDNSMSEIWDPILFTKADDSIFSKLYQNSSTRGDNSMSENLDQHSITKADDPKDEISGKITKGRHYRRGLMYNIYINPLL
jgi:hypothetical protein